MIDFFKRHASPFPGTIGKELDMTEKLGRFGHHPDPAIDFEIEVGAIEGYLFDATHSISKPGTPPITLEEVGQLVERAMDFRVGAEPTAVDAKHVLRKIEADLKAVAGLQPNKEETP